MELRRDGQVDGGLGSGGLLYELQRITMTRIGRDSLSAVKLAT